jgi:hypothetical protein
MATGKKLVPQASDALNSFKYEIANELGIQAPRAATGEMFPPVTVVQ